MEFSKAVKQSRSKTDALEEKLKSLEENLNNEENICLYKIYKKKLEEIIDDVADGVRVKSRYQWYKVGEKSSKFFLNLEKQRGFQGQIRQAMQGLHACSKR